MKNDNKLQKVKHETSIVKALPLEVMTIKDVPCDN